jgi:hypothetical protein
MWNTSSSCHESCQNETEPPKAAVRDLRAVSHMCICPAPPGRRDFLTDSLCIDIVSHFQFNDYIRLGQMINWGWRQSDGGYKNARADFKFTADATSRVRTVLLLLYCNYRTTCIRPWDDSMNIAPIRFARINRAVQSTPHCIVTCLHSKWKWSRRGFDKSRSQGFPVTWSL